MVHAHLREQSSSARDAPEPQHDHVQSEVDDYEAARARILATLPAGWIVASWRVETADHQ